MTKYQFEHLHEGDIVKGVIEEKTLESAPA
jgi:hypothetical protein